MQEPLEHLAIFRRHLALDMRWQIHSLATRLLFAQCLNPRHLLCNISLANMAVKQLTSDPQ